MSQLDPYNRTTDSLDHLESYKSLMHVQWVTDALLYIAFLAMLHKVAQVLYSHLKPRAIDSFEQLEKKFMAHFDTYYKVPQVIDSLFSVH